MNNPQYPETTISVNNDYTSGNSFFRNIAMCGPGPGLVVRASDMRIVFVNDQFTHHLGYTADDIAASHIYFTDLVGEFQTSRFLSQLAQAKNSVQARSTYTIYRVTDKQGQRISFYVYTCPFVQSSERGDEVMYHLLMVPDLSKWGMPFSTFETKELFLEQFDSEDFGTFEWLVDMDKVYWSPGVYRIYEVDEQNEELTSSFARSFVHPADRAKVAEETRKSAAEGRDLNLEFRIITAKQNVKLLHALARTIKDTQGNPIKFAGSIRDITDQRQIEDDLKNKVDALNHSNKELEEFAYVASHDMQEPLRKITTFSDRLSDKYKDQLSGDGSMYLSRIIASAESMRRLINDLLDFSRVAKNMQPFEPVDLNNIIQQVKTDLELVVEETGTTIQANDLPVLDGMKTQMKQLFENIVSNAIKFRRPDVAPVITVEAETVSAADKAFLGLSPKKEYSRIVITDNGIGFDNEYATRIFQVFQRLHGKSEYPGSGIGLAICKKIMDNHEGLIFAEGTPEEGSKFTIIIPKKQ